MKPSQERTNQYLYSMFNIKQQKRIINVSVFVSLFSILLCFEVIKVQAADCPNSGTGWTTQLLNTAIDYKIHHKVVGSSTLHIVLDALTPTSGGRWLGFGFAEQNSGHMKGSDIVTATIENGVVKVDDRYADFAPSKYTEVTGTSYEGLTASIDARLSMSSATIASWPF